MSRLRPRTTWVLALAAVLLVGLAAAWWFVPPRPLCTVVAATVVAADGPILFDLSPDGRHLATWPPIWTRQTPRLWDVATGRELPDPSGGEADALSDFRFTPAGDLLVFRGNWQPRPRGEVRLLEPPAGRELARFEVTDGWCLCPHGRLLAYQGEAGPRLWDAATRTERAAGFSGRPLAFAPGGRTLLTLGDPDRADMLSLWDAGTGQRRCMLELPPPGERDDTGLDYAFSPDGRAVAGWLGWRLRLWDAQTGQMRATVEMAAHTFTYLGGGEVLAVPQDDPGQVLRLRYWEAATGRELRTVAELHRGGEYLAVELMAGPGGKTLAVQVHSKVFPRRWSLWDHLPANLRPGWAKSPDPYSLSEVWFYDEEGKETGRLEFPAATRLDFSGDFRRVAAADEYGVVRVWEVPISRPALLPWLLGAAVLVGFVAWWVKRRGKAVRPV